MQICYLDEAGGCEAPDRNGSATPVMVISGLVVDAASIPALTRDFLALKRLHFPGRFAAGRALDHILIEVKGSEILQMTRAQSRNKRRQAHRFRSELLDLVEAHRCRLIGRIWIKEPGKALRPEGSYCYAVQDISTHFAQFLAAQNSVGIVIADGRNHHTNRNVAHSIFTQKWRTGGDPYPALRDVPLFAASDNHAGLQIADLIASTLIFPMAASAYCPRQPANPHSSGLYNDVRNHFGGRLQNLQYRYKNEVGRWRGGLVVSDPIGRRPGSLLFRPQEVATSTQAQPPAVAGQALTSSAHQP
ncbi:DUF3800 domain-containing protein [Nonomuraea sp. B1E8]|uniref:DUF3800 domain-containing protein n=1 Tax=unclassified Nonomuraea TaxID=2593643 RepID=UPI00325EE673